MSTASRGDAQPSDEPATSDGRNARWAAHRVARRRELVEAALRAIRRHGAGVGMDEIAAEAGTSKTVLYRHLGDRLGVYLAVCESVDALILTEIDAVAAAPAEGNAPRHGAGVPLDLLVAVIDGYLRLVERDPEVYRFVVRRPDVDLPEDTDPVTGLSDRIAANLTPMLTTLSDGDATRAQILAWALVGLVKESADRWLEHAGAISRGQLSRHLAEFAFAGLGGTGDAALPTTPKTTSTRSHPSTPLPPQG